MDFRTLALGVGVFCATFLVGWWLNIGGLASGYRGPAQPRRRRTRSTVGAGARRHCQSEGRGADTAVQGRHAEVGRARDWSTTSSPATL